MNGTVHAEGSLIVTGHVASETLQRILEENKEEIRKRFPSFFMKQLEGRLMEDRRKEALARRAAGMDASPDEPAGSGGKEGLLRRGDVTGRYGLLAVRPIGGEGFFATLWNVLEELDKGCWIQLSRIPVLEETIEICDLYGINPFEAPSGGNLLIVCTRGAELSWYLASQGIPNSLAGVLLPPPARRIDEGDHIRFLDNPSHGQNGIPRQ